MNRQLAPILFLLAAASAAPGQIRDLNDLREGRSEVERASDSLMAQRVRLVVRRDSLSARTDTLLSQEPHSAELLRTGLASRGLLEGLRFVERHLDSLSAVEDSLVDELRSAYDWEISRLHGLLTAGFDAGLFRQLQVLQEEREALGNAIRAASHRLDADHGR